MNLIYNCKMQLLLIPGKMVIVSVCILIIEYFKRNAFKWPYLTGCFVLKFAADA